MPTITDVITAPPMPGLPAPDASSAQTPPASALPVVTSATMPPTPPKRRRNSGRPIPHLASRIFGSVLAVEPRKCREIIAALEPRLNLSIGEVLAYDDEEIGDSEDRPDYSVQDGIACIPVYGTLVKRSTGMDAWSGLTSYESITAIAEDVITDPNVKGILWDFDTPGGEVCGMFDAAEFLYSMRGIKPMYAVVNDQMCSAGYALGSCFDRIYTTSVGVSGSIGCYMVHRNQAGADKQNGYEYTYIFDGARKIDGNPHAELSSEAFSAMQAGVSRIKTMFVALVARNRNVTAESVIATESSTADGAAAVPLFADKVGTLGDARADMMAALGIVASAGDAAAGDADGATQPAGEIPDTLGLPEPDAATEWAAAGEKDAILDASGLLAKHGGNVNATLASLYMAAGNARHGSAEAALKDGRILAVRNFGSSHRRSTAAIKPQPASSQANAPGAPANAPANAPVNDRTIACCVAPYGRMSSDIGGFREVYQAGCFRESLASSDDLRALFDHASFYVLGRRSANTARFYEEPDGLHFEAEAPATTWADDLLVSMDRGDITGGSAAFFILQAHWEYCDGGKVRVIERARLVEGSVASFPAYESSRAEVQPASASTTTHPIEQQGEQQPQGQQPQEQHPELEKQRLEGQIQQQQLGARLRMLNLR